MAKANPKCWCGFKSKSNQGLSIHKNRQGHWHTPEEKQRIADLNRKKEEATKQTVTGYIDETTEHLSNGRELQVGDKVRVDRIGVIKEITITGNETTVSVRIDVISRTYKSI